MLSSRSPQTLEAGPSQEVKHTLEQEPSTASAVQYCCTRILRIKKTKYEVRDRLVHIVEVQGLGAGGTSCSLQVHVLSFSTSYNFRVGNFDTRRTLLKNVYTAVQYESDHKTFN